MNGLLKNLAKVLTLSLVIMFSLSAVGKEITICTEDSQWYPYTFLSNGKIEGSLVEITKRAFANLDIPMQIVMQPWRRCLLDVKLGNMDGAIGASFSTERAEYMFYPPDAAAAKFEKRPAQGRLEHVEYVTISVRADNFEFDGDLLALPQPVYLPQGFSLVEELRKEGVEVDTSSRRDIENVHRLALRKQGSVVLIRPLAEYALTLHNYQEIFSLSQKPVVGKSVFTGFSKKGQMDKKLRDLVWQQLEVINMQKDEILTDVLKLTPDVMDH